MKDWVLLTLLILALLPAIVLASSIYRPARAWASRISFVVTAALVISPWIWPFLGSAVPARTASVLVIGAVTGGIVLSAATGGIVEENEPPSVAVQRRVLMYHTASMLRRRPQPRGKRVFDVVGTLVGLTLTLPLWPIIGLLIWFEEPGPILFVKNSVGRGGATFRQFKFRSMRYGAERLTGPVASPADDSRTLKVGRWLRRWHLDELPELINVLGGSMSLVGPRPMRTVLVDTHLATVAEYAERHTVRPGIACIAQIEKFHMPPRERLVKDLAYIEHQSVMLDLKLLIRAVVTTVRSERQYDRSSLLVPASTAKDLASRSDGQHASGVPPPRERARSASPPSSR